MSTAVATLHSTPYTQSEGGGNNNKLVLILTRHTLATDRPAWRAMLKSGQPPPEYRARPPTPAALPIAYTRARRSTMAATVAKIDRDVRTLRDITNLL